MILTFMRDEVVFSKFSNRCQQHQGNRVSENVEVQVVSLYQSPQKRKALFPPSSADCRIIAENETKNNRSCCCYNRGKKRKRKNKKQNVKNRRKKAEQVVVGKSVVVGTAAAVCQQDPAAEIVVGTNSPGR